MQSIYMYISPYIFSLILKENKKKKGRKKNRLNILFALRWKSINDVTFLLRNKSLMENFSFLLFLIMEVTSFATKFLWITFYS